MKVTVALIGAALLAGCAADDSLFGDAGRADRGEYEQQLKEREAMVAAERRRQDAQRYEQEQLKIQQRDLDAKVKSEQVAVASLEKKTGELRKQVAAERGLTAETEAQRTAILKEVGELEAEIGKVKAQLSSGPAAEYMNLQKKRKALESEYTELLQIYLSLT